MFTDKKYFEEPVCMVTAFDVQDVLTVSGEEDPDPSWGGGESGL